MRRVTFCAAPTALAALAAGAVAAPDEQDRKDLEEIRREMAEMKRNYEKRISDLEARLAKSPASAQPELQGQIDDLLDRVDTIDSKLGAVKTSIGGGRASYIDISFNSLLAAGTSTTRNEQIFEGLEGGHHDPHRRGFTVQNTELVLNGAIDPFFKGFANLVQTVDEEGETVVELEEVYAQTTSLPAGLQVKAGKSFLEFGRHNTQHPHQWEFVDMPVVMTRMFSDDGINGTGARLSWLAPTSFPFEVLAGLYNANGNPMVSFMGPGEDGPPFGAQQERTVRAFRDLTWLLRANASFDLNDEMPVLFGVSGLYGPSGATQSGSTSIVGADVTFKWRPLANDHGFPFVAFTAETMRRHFGFDSFVDGSTYVPGGELQDSGGYAQLVYGFQRDWTIGVRYDRVNGRHDDVFGLDTRDRLSAALTFYTSEFAKIRLQVNVDDARALRRREQSVWLQFEFNVGTHGAHKF